jgi:hypothetical protein
VTDYLEQKYREITARIAELAPLVKEHNRLTAAVDALAGLGIGVDPKTASVSKKRTRGRGRPASPKKQPRPNAKAQKTASSKKSTSAGTSGRAAQALSLVHKQPGITIAELAKALGIQKSYLYRVLPALQKDGKVTRHGNGWHPTES